MKHNLIIVILLAFICLQSTNDYQQVVKLKSYAFDDLPDLESVIGDMVLVTDCGTRNAFDVVTGSGANVVIAVFDGSNWIVH